MSRLGAFRIEIKHGATVLDISDKVVSLTVKDSLLTGGMDWKIVVETKKLNAEEDWMFDNKLRELRFSCLRDNAEVTTGWKWVLVRKSKLYFVGSLSVITIWGTGFWSLLQAEEKRRAFSNMQLADVVARIAVEHGLMFDVSRSGIATSGTWYQLGETDANFLCRVCSESLAASGHKKLWVYVDNKQLRVEAINYSKPTVRNFGIGVADDRLENVEFSNFGRDVDCQGGAKSIGLGFNILQKQFVELPIVQNIAPLLAGKLPRPATSGTRFRMYSHQDTLSIQHNFFSDWIDASSRYIAVQGTIVGDLTLRPGDIVNFNVVDTNGNPTSFNGKYPIYEIVHLYQSVGTTMPMTSVVGCFRRSFHYGDMDAEGSNLSRFTTVENYQPFAALVVPMVSKISKGLS